MKKIILSFVLVAGLFSAISASAERITAALMSVEALKNIASQQYGTRIDSDGDLVITKGDNTIYVSVIKKAKLIRLTSSFSPYDKRSISEMIVIANKFNYDKRFMRVCIDVEDGSSICDFYMIYDGGIDSKNFLEAIDWFYVLKESWTNYVINGGDE